MAGLFVFLTEFLRTPKQIGSIAPSSTALARAMVDAADLRDGQAVVELGAGTGPFTRAIRELHPGVSLLALEPSQRLAATLRSELPGVEVVEGLAQDLPALARAWGHERVDRLVSGLPWTVWPEEVITAGLDAVCQTLVPDGRMVTFSYLHAQALLPGARRFRKLLGERFEKVWRTPAVWRNLPPATVFVCERPLATARDRTAP